MTDPQQHIDQDATDSQNIAQIASMTGDMHFHQPDVETPPGKPPLPHSGLSGRFPHGLRHLNIIGRDKDMKAVRLLLVDNPVTVVLGLGGVGKTRLAAEIVHTAAFANGIIWHTVTDLSTSDRLTELVRDHLRLPIDTPPDRAWAELWRWQTLIVLDNAEACKATRGYCDLLNSLDPSGGSRVLITSRAVWKDLQMPKRFRLKTPDLPAAIEIVREMADKLEPAFSLDGQQGAIAKAARAHPKLIEYAVKWADNLPVDEVLAELKTLTGDDAEAALDDMVHKTIRYMTDRESGQDALAALRRFVVFRGGFTLDAARALVERAEKPLKVLRQWGLVGDPEKGRYDIDPLVVAAVEADETAHPAHYDYFKALANAADKSTDHEAYLGLDVESANLEAGFEWAMRTGDAYRVYWMANAARPFLANRGRFRQQMDWLGRAANALESSDDEYTKSAAQNSLGIAYQDHPFGNRADNLRRAITAYEEALRFRTPEAAPLDYATALKYATVQNNLGTAYQNLSEIKDRETNLRRAITAYEEALRFRTPEAAPLNYATTQNNLAIAYRDLSAIEDREDNLRRAITAYEEALRFRTPEAAPLDYAMTQNNLGAAYNDLAAIEDREANLRRAVTACEQALRFYTPKAAPLDYAMTQANLGILREDMGDLPAAVACWREAERYYRQMGHVADADEVLAAITRAESADSADESAGDSVAGDDPGEEA